MTTLTKRKTQNGIKVKNRADGGEALRKPLTTLSLTFDIGLHPRQIQRWRGMVAESAGLENELFHNHNSAAPDAEGAAADGLHHRYPLIHYRSRGGKACLWGMGEGAEALKNWAQKMQAKNGDNNWRLQQWIEKDHTLELTPDTFHTYRLMDWIALNGANYHQWKQCGSLAERVALLDNILAAHLLKFASGAGWVLPQRLEARLLLIRDIRQVRLFGENRMAFNAVYRANIRLPDGIALGSAVAFGFGYQQATAAQDF